MKSTAKESIFDQLVEGLEASIQYSKGTLSLRSVTLPAPPPVPSPVQIVQLREKHRMSQPIFAATLNVSSKTVQAWEQGQRVPSHASVRLLQIFEKEPEVVVRMVGGVPTNTPSAPIQRTGGSTAGGGDKPKKSFIKLAAKKKAVKMRYKAKAASK